MFEISEGALPFVRTRQALLVLDVQIDLVSTDGAIPVEEPERLVTNIINLSSSLRPKDSIIWVKTIFEKHRDVNNNSLESEWVVTNKELQQSNVAETTKAFHGPRPPSRKLQELYDKILERYGQEEEDPESPASQDGIVDNETFLTIEPGQRPRYLLADSRASGFPDAVMELVEDTKDMVFTKSHYSAFKSGQLLKHLRGQFVTALLICGALTNISIYATAMDAARHGYSLTLVEDCLGYRSKERHDEALRLLVEATGCDIRKSSDIVDGLREKEPPPARSGSSKKAESKVHDSDHLHHSIERLNLKDGKYETSSRSNQPSKLPSTASHTVPDLPAHISAESSTSSGSVVISSEESAPNVSMSPGKPELEARKRVPSKIKTRRRRSRSNIPENGTKNMEKSESQSKNDEKPLSPTQVTLTAASEALQKVHLTSHTDEATALALPTSSTISDVNGKGKTLSKIPTLEEDQGAPPKGTLPQPGAERNGKVSEQSISEAPPVDSRPICEGDTVVVHDLIPDDDAVRLFERIRDEVRWQKMLHQGGDVPRLVAVQGTIEEDGSIPLYRHPADESPPLLAFTPSVALVRKKVEAHLGHSVNHCLIQLYRSGTDYISEHSDKTLDIVPDTFIANVSFGAMRTMTFRTKKLKPDDQVSKNTVTPRTSFKAALPHNSMCKMGLMTNMRWLHSIRQDKRDVRVKAEAELAFGGMRLSLTFRSIGTYLDSKMMKIWGQGAVAKHKRHARPVLNGKTVEAGNMLLAFGKENQSSDFDWPEVYGQGFDVLHISNIRKLFLSTDPISNLRVKIMLAELDISWTSQQLSPAFNWTEGQNSTEGDLSDSDTLLITFVDNDLARSTVKGDLAILLYLNDVYGRQKLSIPQEQIARQFTRLQQTQSLLQQWKTAPLDIEAFRKTLAMWDSYAAEDDYLSGSTVSVVDFAFWPILQQVMDSWNDGSTYPCLQAYHARMLSSRSVLTARSSCGPTKV